MREALEDYNPTVRLIRLIVTNALAYYRETLIKVVKILIELS